MKENTYSGGADEDFVFWDNPIRKIAKDIIVYEDVIGKYMQLDQLCSDDQKCMDFSKEVKSVDDLEVYVAKTIKNKIVCI